MISEKRMMKNCEKCRIRKLQEKYMGRIFDYHNCPYVCLTNKVDNRNLPIGRKERMWV